MNGKDDPKIESKADLQKQVQRLQRTLRQKEQSLELVEKVMDNLERIYRSAMTHLSEQKAELNQNNLELEETRKSLLMRNRELQQIREELLLKNSALESASSTDALTGILNRKKINWLLEREIHRCQRYNTSFSVILMDIDHFKSINDRFGHLEGDKALIRVVKAVSQSLRTADLFGRWGGEEFLILCPSTPGVGALALAEKLRRAIERQCSVDQKAMTASFGVAGYETGDQMETLVRKADKALYRAKQTRNATRLFPPAAQAQVNTA